MSNKPTITPSFSDFQRLARSHDLVPICKPWTADLETPVSAFLRVAYGEPEAFLLESVEGGENVGRYTFMGIRPYKKIIAHGRQLTTHTGAHIESSEGDVFEVLRDSLAGHTSAKLPGLPPFTAGAVGFFSYDAVRLIEKIPEKAKDELGMPDACLMFFDTVLAFDRVKQQILLIATADLQRNPPRTAYANAVQRLNELERRLSKPLPRQVRHTPRGKLQLKPRTRKQDYLAGVQRIKDYITAGDVFQTVLSQRFDVEPGVDPFAIYRALRIVNPSPYMYFLRMGLRRPGDTHLAGSSPELLVRVHGRKVEYRPIAGTRWRAEEEEEDRRIEAELRTDEKEVAEHIMLVDLGRNDVGRVSEYGSVQVKELMFVERYSHVMHLVSALEGTLREGLSAIDAFRACFPAGTLSGAPKVRAMEIIEELEPARRGVYGGSVFYADFSGNFDSCIAIRSLLMRGKQGHIQAGGGIVADSDAEKEYEESINKAKAVVRAIERARGQ
ncbi:MAG TPA: anthranilate synthase component I [Acidobacteriaceae bacterium]|nr:anthranilate synthase component I [Acidobacteriaceae bacterium]